jgi:hypothetical protein
MARPNTLAQAVERVASGESRASVWAGLLDTFYGARTEPAQRNLLVEEPPLTGDARLDCLAAATAEYLWKQHGLGTLPTWIGKPERILPEPWFTASMDAPGIREYLSFASPAEFIHHNIFTDEAPFRRASQG